MSKPHVKTKQISHGGVIMQYEPPPNPDDYETKEEYEIAFKKWKKGFDKAMRDFGYPDDE